MTTFSPVGGRSVKLRCDDCGHTGYDTDGTGWMAHHQRGHAPCPRCGRVLTLSAKGHPRKHSQCAPPDPITAAISAVNRALGQHRRLMSPQGVGVQCKCGQHYDTREEWETHQAWAATAAATTILGNP